MMVVVIILSSIVYLGKGLIPTTGALRRSQ